MALNGDSSSESLSRQAGDAEAAAEWCKIPFCAFTFGILAIKTVRQWGESKINEELLSSKRSFHVSTVKYHCVWWNQIVRGVSIDGFSLVGAIRNGFDRQEKKCPKANSETFVGRKILLACVYEMLMKKTRNNFPSYDLK